MRHRPFSASLGRSRPALCTAVLAGVAIAGIVVGGCGGGGGDGGGDPVTATDGRVTIDAEDTVFNYDRIDATPGPLDVTLLQKGQLDHTFVVEDADGNEIGTKLAVGSEDRDEGTFELTAGEYEYFCDIPGHRGQGMEGTLIVE